MLSRENSELSPLGGNIKLSTDMKDINLPQGNSVEEQSSNAVFDKFVENTSKKCVLLLSRYYSNYLNSFNQKNLKKKIH